MTETPEERMDALQADIAKTIADLMIRVDALEKVNRTLWDWVQLLAGQDALLVEFVTTIFDGSDAAIERKEKIFSQIINNRDIAGERKPSDD